LQGTNTNKLIGEGLTEGYILPLNMEQIKIIHKLLHFYIFEKLFVGILKLPNEQHNCFTSYSNKEQPKAMRMYAATLTTPSMKLFIKWQLYFCSLKWCSPEVINDSRIQSLC